MATENYFDEEDNSIRRRFNLEEVIAFQKSHRVEVLMMECLQYGCFIDYKDGDAAYGVSFTFLGALVDGIRSYKQHPEFPEKQIR